MKYIVFDAGPIISLTANNSLWLLEDLKAKFEGKFILPLSVKRELVDKPLQTRRFKLEAILVQRLIDRGIFEVPRSREITEKARKLMNLANNILSGHNHSINILQIGEVEVIACALHYNADTIVVDERITRTLIENPEGLHRLMEKKMHVQLNLNKSTLSEFSRLTKHISVIRSIELVTVAYEMGLLDKYVVNIPHAKRELLESLLWGLKTEGASVSDEEINAIIKSSKL